MANSIFGSNQLLLTNTTCPQCTSINNGRSEKCPSKMLWRKMKHYVFYSQDIFSEISAVFETANTSGISCCIFSYSQNVWAQCEQMLYWASFFVRTSVVLFIRKEASEVSRKCDVMHAFPNLCVMPTKLHLSGRILLFRPVAIFLSANGSYTVGTALLLMMSVVVNLLKPSGNFTDYQV
jgi:hypothetical protein